VARAPDLRSRALVDLDWEDPAPLVQGTGHGAVLVAIRTVLADGHARSAADICREGIPRGDEAYHVVLDARRLPRKSFPTATPSSSKPHASEMPSVPTTAY